MNSSPTFHGCFLALLLTGAGFYALAYLLGSLAR